MGTDFNIKPVGAPVATLLVRPGPDATRSAVPTDLPPDKSVNASDNSSATSPSATYRSQQASDQVAHQVIVDREAAQIVYVTVDQTTNAVVSQFPEESKLRARAYLRSLDEAKLTKKALATDRSV